MAEFEHNVKSDDPVQRMVSAGTPEFFVTWLIEHHGAKESSRKTIESNLREQFRWHRLQGRLDRGGWLNFFATLMGLKQSPIELKTPDNFWNNDNA
jgi:hypothetical protein